MLSCFGLGHTENERADELPKSKLIEFIINLLWKKKIEARSWSNSSKRLRVTHFISKININSLYAFTLISILLGILFSQNINLESLINLIYTFV